MSDTPEKLQHELQAALRTINELQAKLESSETIRELISQNLEAGRKEIEHAHQEWMAALDVVDDPIFLHDREFRILRCNRAYQQRAGIPFKQIIGQPYYEIFPKTDGPLPCCTRAMEAEKEEAEEEVIVGEAVYRSRTFVTRDEQGAYHYSVHTLENITAHKRAKEELRLRAQLLDSVSDSIFVADFGGNFVYLNEAAWKSRGYTLDELMAMNLHVLDTPEYGEIIGARIRELMEKGQSVFESAHYRKDGSVMPIEVSARIIESGGRKLVLAAVRDITERRRAEQALHESEKLYRSLFENMLNGFAYCRMIFEDDQPQDFVYLNVNAAFETLTGLKNVAGKRVSEVIPGIRQSDPGLFEIYGRVSLSGKPERFEIYVEALRQWFWVSVYSPANGYFVAVFDVITERKQAEIAIAHANRALTALSTVNRTLVHATDENELLQAICQAIVKQRGYRLAWVGYVQHDESRSIKIMARAGRDEGYLDAMQLTWAESERGMGSSGRAIRSGVTQVCQDIAHDPHYLPWRDAALKRGYAANIAFPLKNGEVFGILNVYAAEANTFAPKEIDLLEEMAGDLAFGVHTLHTRRERDLAQNKIQQQLAQLQSNLEDTVRAIATIVEMRDPYTAGHQARVADLAAAIARQLGLPEEQAHAIHLAGVVHDLGKINVPAEILSKPGKINNLEFGLIKIHPQAGYDILKGISFPWPIAQMVLQHHERLDGSGYPQGVNGDQIILEARILSVADVVEAISAHRPYRPGLGIDAALEEIARMRGAHYDPRVVDACVSLFRERGYALPQ